MSKLKCRVKHICRRIFGKIKIFSLINLNPRSPQKILFFHEKTFFCSVAERKFPKKAAQI